MTETPDNRLAKVATLIDQHRDQPGPLLPLLHSIQDQLGYIPADAVPQIADALSRTRADIEGVISFYHHFRTTEPTAHQLQICRAEACQARGSRELEQHAKTSLEIDFHQSTADRTLSLEPVYCLGNCACGPNIQIDDQVVGRVTPERLDALVESLRTQPLEVK
ncbi:formate dehydrogenase subunit gamma [Motiliproteus coralliicola]|uniref:NADH-quinone oxidoreductase subunit E n=1 Tax=Motiliproteus coralliicola TaxID=2283196 RepID=A0A369WFM3_9GAMM|nr:formate dehydrogenase subunit gamma [Motiliproteus coralliicola]RDE19396.1 formate dehydrogenase subunit gamma [Motiliproteus coralliicola]